MRGYDNLGSKKIFVRSGDKKVPIIRKVFRHRRTGNTIARWEKCWNLVEEDQTSLSWHKVVDKPSISAEPEPDLSFYNIRSSGYPKG